jgi:hypothetical protein
VGKGNEKIIHNQRVTKIKKGDRSRLFGSNTHLNLFGDVSDQVQYFVRVAGFVVVPGYQFNEVVVQSDTSFSIEY